MTKLKTVEDLELWEWADKTGNPETILKKEAIEWLLYAIKKKKNPYKSFMDFHNITDEDLIK